MIPANKLTEPNSISIKPPSKPDHRSFAEKVFFPVRILGWVFNKCDAGKVIRFNNKTDTVLAFLVDYDNHEPFLNECASKNVNMRAVDNDWTKLSYVYEDYMFIENANFKNRESRLIVHIAVPHRVLFLLEAEIYGKAQDRVADLAEVDEKERYIYGKIETMMKAPADTPVVIPTADEFVDIFKALENLFDAYDLNIHQFITNIINT